MSLQELCSITTATIKRVAVTKDASAGQIRNYTTAARGTLPTTSIGRLVQMGGDRRFSYDMHDLETPAKWYTTTDPQVDERDVLFIGIDTYFVQNVNNPDLLGRYFIISLKVYTRELQ
jgi:hypothetical protein